MMSQRQHQRSASAPIPHALGVPQASRASETGSLSRSHSEAALPGERSIEEPESEFEVIAIDGDTEDEATPQRHV